MKIRAWIKPLREGWMYYASLHGEILAHGSAWSEEAAHDAVADALYGRGEHDWEIEVKPPTHKGAPCR